MFHLEAADLGQGFVELLGEVRPAHFELRGVLRQGIPFLVEVAFVEGHERRRGERDVVPGQFVAQQGLVFEGAHRLVVDGGVVLVQVGAGGDQDPLGVQLAFHRHHVLQHLLAVVAELAHRVVHDLPVLRFHPEHVKGGVAFVGQPGRGGAVG